MIELSNGGSIHDVLALLLDLKPLDMALNRIESTDASTNSRTVAKIGITFTKPYSLNIEKSLLKKSKAAKRNHISYNCTGGGFTAELDAITFELFSNACEIFYIQSANSFYDVRKDVSNDKSGNTVQKTYKVREDETDNYTINLYLTKCSILVNGKYSTNFINRDLPKLHEIISQTTINGETIDIQETNKVLAQKLDSILKQSSNDSNKHHVNEHNNTKEEEKCQKCNRICRIRAVYCVNKHWVHFKCERLSETDIKKLEKQDNSTYECSMCCDSQLKGIKPFSLCNTFKKVDKTEITATDTSSKPTLAQEILLDENLENCPACLHILTSEKSACSICCQQFHDQCFLKDSNLCYACHGTFIQTLDNTALPNEQQSVNFKTHANINTTVTPISQTPVVSYTQDNNNITRRALQTKTPCNNGAEQSSISTDNDHTQEPSIKLKELRQLEQKLKKKEEQLKIKEAMLNDDSKEKEKILERLFKAENRNLELELTVKTLNRRISLLEEQPKHPMTEQASSKHSNSSNGSTDELITGVRDKVTRYVLSKIDSELDKLLGQAEQTQSSPLLSSDCIHVPDNSNRSFSPSSVSQSMNNDNASKIQNQPNRNDIIGMTHNPTQCYATQQQMLNQNIRQSTKPSQITTPRTHQPQHQEHQYNHPTHTPTNTQYFSKTGQPIFYAAPSNNHFLASVSKHNQSS